MARPGLPGTGFDVCKSLSARPSKSDAEGLAKRARTGRFTPVHIRSEAADRLRSLIGARDRVIRLRKPLLLN